jgi:hypothetical protein
MKYVIWFVGFPVAFLAMTLSANAAMYKCTDADGNVSFSDKACPEERQEILKERTTSRPPETNPAESKSALEGDAFPTIERIESLAGGKKVTSSSPLAKAYTRFLNAVKRCDRKEMMKHVSSKMAQGMSSATDKEFKDGCRGLEMFLPRDFKNATEVIEGDRGKIQWLSVKTTTDSSGTMTMKSEQTEDFVRENGVWKYGD